MQPDYFLGLDLGQTTDFTALAVIERPSANAGEEPVYALRHLQRFPLSTAYTTIVPAVARLAGTAPLHGRSTLVVDQTGVGRPLVEMLYKAPVPCRIVPVTITGGHAVTAASDGGLHVPKKELVTSLQLLFQGRRLLVARTLPEVQPFIRELLNFRVKITKAANETFEALRESDHDDLVLAVALACWQAEREPRWHERAIQAGGEEDSLMAQMPDDVFASGGM